MSQKNQISNTVAGTFSKEFRTGYAAVVGLPNAGKSTLLNQLLQRKLAIVTRKPQTTRKNVIGILNDKNYQIIFTDTPGIISPKYSLQKAMMKNVKSAMANADVLVYLIDISGKKQPLHDLKDQLSAIKNKPVILALNKIDTIKDRQEILPLIKAYNKLSDFEAIVPISAKKNIELDGLLKRIVQRLPLSHPYFPIEYISDQQERFFVAEIIREKIFKLYSQEIPYSCHVEIENFQERKGRKDFIQAAIIVEKNSQKSILIGKQGRAIKKVGEYAREEIELFLDRPVFLNLFVKVKDDWRKSDRNLKDMGYV